MAVARHLGSPVPRYARIRRGGEAIRCFGNVAPVPLCGITRVRPGGAVSFRARGGRALAAVDPQQRPRDQRDQRQRDRQHREVGDERQDAGHALLLLALEDLLVRTERAREARLGRAPPAPGSPRPSAGRSAPRPARRPAGCAAWPSSRRRPGSAWWSGTRPGPTFSSGSRTRFLPPCHAVTFMNSGSFDGVARVEPDRRRHRAPARRRRCPSARPGRAPGPSVRHGQAPSRSPPSARARPRARRGGRPTRAGRRPRG